MRKCLLYAAVGTVGLLGMATSLAAAADMSRGERLFMRCERCHSLEPGGSTEDGPSLHGVFGRKAGTANGFAFSEALKSSEVVWTDETLDQFLADPKAFIPDNTMNMPPVRKPEDRADVIAILHEKLKQ
ncbi:MAG: c-type cytochrome [Hyphomicrobiales bacterium]|nr:c-type cytochrome [Hyphomicrobiales bacterium]